MHFVQEMIKLFAHLIQMAFFCHFVDETQMAFCHFVEETNGSVISWMKCINVFGGFILKIYMYNFVAQN